MPPDWRIDGMPEVRLDSAAGALRALPSMRELYLDEQRAFERVLCQLSGPRGARWWTGAFDPSIGQRAVVLVRRRRGLPAGAFRRFLHGTLAESLLRAGARELRTHAFLPGSRFSHWTPGVAHDDPVHRRYAAAIVLGADDRSHLEELLAGPSVQATREAQIAHCTAFHAYAVEQTLPLVLAGRQVARAGHV